MSQLSQQNLKDYKTILSFGFDLGEDLDKALKDGRIRLLEYRYFIDDVGKIDDMIEAAKRVWSTEALSDEAKQEIANYIKDDFNIENQEWEQYIERSLKILVEFMGLIKAIRNR